MREYAALTDLCPCKAPEKHICNIQLEQQLEFPIVACSLCRAACLTVTSCFYHDLLSAEGVPELACACCCGVDRVW
jgi:hypothetical protein